MIITCPSCSAQFAVPVAAIGATGRTVRCSACGHQWFQDPPSQVMPPISSAAPAAAAMAAQPAAAQPSAADVAPAAASPSAPSGAPDAGREAEADPDARIAAEPPEGPEADDFEAMMAQERRRPPHINLPAVPAGPPRRRGVMIGWLVLAVVVIGLMGGAVLARDRIVTFWPPAVKAYDLLGIDVTEAAIREIPPGLTFPDPPVLSFEREGDADVLVVEVTITNVGEQARRLPPLEMSLLDAQGDVVDLWVHDTAWPAIAPGETLVVVTRRTDPPVAATDFHMEPAAVPRSERPADPPAEPPGGESEPREGEPPESEPAAADAY